MYARKADRPGVTAWTALNLASCHFESFPIVSECVVQILLLEETRRINNIKNWLCEVRVYRASRRIHVGLELSEQSVAKGWINHCRCTLATGLTSHVLNGMLIPGHEANINGESRIRSTQSAGIIRVFSRVQTGLMQSCIYSQLGPRLLLVSECDGSL